MNPLPPSTGVNFCYPGPRTHDGLHLKDNAPEKEGLQTQALVDRNWATKAAMRFLLTRHGGLSEELMKSSKSTGHAVSKVVLISLKVVYKSFHMI